VVGYEGNNGAHKGKGGGGGIPALASERQYSSRSYMDMVRYG